MKRKAFSLIELMVVIAIIGVLAAIAIPSYKNYTSRARLSDTMRAFDMLNSQIVTHYNEKGYFPLTLSVFGYTTDVSGNAFTNANTLSPANVQGLAFFAIGSAYPANPVCSQMGYSTYSFSVPNDNYAIGGNYLLSLEYFYPIGPGEIIKPYCFYTYVDNTVTEVTQDMGINGCQNRFGSGAADYAYVDAIRNNLPSNGCT
jgi:prepilin-type N-terminal cleavage/methylation domain-containing protein